MRFSDDVLRSIKERCSVEETISKYVQLKQHGSRLVGLCPFHSEKTPSFTVFSDTQSFYCFGCGAGGDVITFIMRCESLEYSDAVKLLADRCGIRIEQDEEAEKAMKQRARILALNKDAARFFHEMLFSEQGAEGLDYLKKRGLKKSTITRFGLGYAPDSWDMLTGRMLSLGYTQEELISANLSARSKKGSCYDVFRHRVMFPIIDLTGRVIAFGGRRIGDDDPRKYINSSNTPVYKKGQTVFALNFAKGAEKLILTEGYLDAISLHEAGFTGAVATCGTAITDEQCRTLARYFDEVNIAYDSDGAGRTATAKAITLFKHTGIAINVIAMEGAKDPDEFIRRYGKEKFGELLYASESYIDYRIAQIKAMNDISRPDGKVRYINAAVEVIADEDSALKREVYASRIAEQTEVDKKTVLNEIESIRKRRGNISRRDEANRMSKHISGSDDKINPQKRNNLRAARAEEEVVRCLFAYPSVYDRLKGELSDEDFSTDFNRRIFDCIVSVIIDCKTPALSDFNAEFSPAEMGAVTRILLDAEKVPLDEDGLMKMAAVVKEEKGKLTGDAIRDMAPEALRGFIEGLKNKQ